jgi:large subunit ribosomal protein L18
MKSAKRKTRARRRRHLGLRKKVVGTASRPRLCVFRSLKHIYCQIVDDAQAKTLAAASTLSPELKGKLPKTWDVEAAGAVGKLVGEKAKSAGIAAVVFDRGGCKYHGRVKALAEGARAAGLEF